VQAFHQNETIAVAPHQDGRLLAGRQYARGDFIDGRGAELRSAFDRDVDVGDRKRLALHHPSGIPKSGIPMRRLDPNGR
jgi:hypothetical protein